MLYNGVKIYLENLKLKREIDDSIPREYHIAEEIKKILENNKEYTPTEEDKAEQIAFHFIADYKNKDTSWGTYYGPQYVLPHDGQMMEYPSIQKVTEKTLDYWTLRAKETKHPILSSRYADLVVDFSPKIIRRSADNDLYKIVIDSNIAICKDFLTSPIDCVTKAERALRLAVYKKDQERIARMKDTIINLEESIAIDDKAGLWGFAFRWLLLDFTGKITLNKEEQDHLINTMEENLERIKHLPWPTEHAVSLLAEYYAKEKDEKNLMRVLNILENSLKEDPRLHSEDLLKINAYERIHQIYREYAGKGFNEAKKANERISQEISQLDLDLEKSLKKRSIEIGIKQEDQEDIDKHINFIFDEDKNNSLEIVMRKIAIYHLPRKNTIQKNLSDTSNKYPMQFLVSQKIISDKGVPIATLPALNEDRSNDDHLINHAKLYIKMGSPILLLVIDELKKRYSEQMIIAFFEKSVLFKKNEQNYVKHAISAYWRNDHLVSSHLFIPLIESGIRKLIHICGGSTLRTNDVNGYDYKSLHALLRDNGEIFKQVFPRGDDLLFYIRVVLIETLGMNLRNNFAHGRNKMVYFRKDVSDILFYILTWLYLVVEKKDEENA